MLSLILLLLKLVEQNPLMMKMLITLILYKIRKKIIRKEKRLSNRYQYLMISMINI